MIDRSTRREAVLMYEGQALHYAGNHGADIGAYNARCCVDGAMNALVRIAGREEAVEYAFALSDRIAGGLREPTEYPPKLPAPKVAIIEPKPAPSPKPRRIRFFTIFIVAWLFGFYTAWSMR